MFDGAVDYISDPQRAVQAEAVDHIIQASEVLRAGYLERMQRAQERIVEVVEERAAGHIDRRRRRRVAAAFSALSIAHQHAARTGTPLSQALDAAMEAVSTIS
jgi:hypothetical protein